jgi:hypothetical protein
MKANKLLEKHGLKPTYSRVSKINDWYARNPCKRATLITVPRNRRIHKDYELIGRVATPQTDVWITEFKEHHDAARALLKQYDYVETQHRIELIADWLRVYRGATPELVLVTRETEVFVVGTMPKLNKDIMIREKVLRDE